MVEFTWSKLVEYFHDQHKEITNDLLEGKTWSTYAFSTWEGNRRKSEKHYVKAFSAQEMRYQVVTSHNPSSAGGGNHSYDIRLLERTCSCGKWQNIGIPVHILNHALSTYSHAFVVPKSQSLWREPMGRKWLPNLALVRGKGRPVKSRIRNEMDGVRNKDRAPGSRREDADLIESQPKQTCGLCHASGHNRKKCPQSFVASISGHVPN
ncbi:hypothetical protein SO802_023249 [Lithocarpus litseifolius]|uniref:Uncharacterized protein n=1 Tax=Lithocarpus litseifolius TaxID=425828 RepID=A0AAW2C5T0_9ROSI